jgi:hypothetical protein
VNLDQQHFNGSCHCGTVRFRVRLSEGLRTARRCNCSMCRMKGAVAVTARVGDLEVVSGKDALTLYQFNSKVARHHFCSRCGIHTHHQRRSNPDEFGVNVACLEGISPFDFPAVPVNEGVHHPSDGEGYPSLAGVLRFQPAPRE